MGYNPIVVVGMSPWEILGLPEYASDKDIAAARRMIAQTLHPDVNKQFANIFLIVDAAAIACRDGGWPVEVETPRVHRVVFRVKDWHMSKAGNWTRRYMGGHITVFPSKRGKGYSWVGPDPDGSDNPVWSDCIFDNEDDAKDDADTYFEEE
jgi:hypothetical protein